MDKFDANRPTNEMAWPWQRSKQVFASGNCPVLAITQLNAQESHLKLQNFPEIVFSKDKKVLDCQGIVILLYSHKFASYPTPFLFSWNVEWMNIHQSLSGCCGPFSLGIFNVASKSTIINYCHEVILDVKRKAVSKKRQNPQMAIKKWGAQLRLATEFVIQANWTAPQLQMNWEWVVSYERTPKVCYFWSSAGPPSFLMGNLWETYGFGAAPFLRNINF